jgi:23S rRNA (adenine2503-C2)-methyltransferase
MNWTWSNYSRRRNWTWSNNGTWSNYKIVSADGWYNLQKALAPLVTTPSAVPDLAEMSLAELEQFLAELGEERFHARQVFQWIYKRGVSDFGQMSDLSKGLRGSLQGQLSFSTPRVVSRERSADGTEKFVLEVGSQETHRIESVFIPDTPAMTFCISTQVGCAMGCAFCLTGKMGLARNLTAGEIVGQVLVLAQSLALLHTRFNIVQMGMGEPLHNYEETMKALRILADPSGLAISPRRVTLSTVGLVPALDRLAAEPFMPNLAISLHAATEEQRSRLVPLNRKYRIEDVIAACRRFPIKRRDRITFEYVLLAGVNDAPEDARRLVRLLNGLRAKVNLIPLNEAAGIPFARPSDDRVDAFARILADQHVTVSVRKSRGRDIRAACGQLIVEGQKRSPGQWLAAALGANS